MTAPLSTPPASPAPTSQPSGLQKIWRGWIRPFVVVAVIMIAMRSSLIDWNVVPTGSMKPTILEGDYIFVNKLAYDLRVPLTGQQLWTVGQPRRGDIVVFTPPGERDRFVKRVVGVPGDVIELRENRLLVNGRVAEYHGVDANLHADVRAEPPDGDWFGQEIVAGRAHAVMLSSDSSAATSFDPVVVPEAHYFMMGDNRDNSKDSRVFGFVSRDRVIGRVGRVAVSLDPERHHAPRWHRLFQPLS